MWIDSVKRRVRSSHLDSASDQLEASGLLTEFVTLIRRSKNLNPAVSQSDLLGVLKILTEEIWKEAVKIEHKPSERQTVTHTRMAKSYSINDFATVTSPVKQSTGFTSTRKSDLLNSSNISQSSKYKQQISEDIAYMSTFSFPKGCGTFYKTRRLTGHAIPDNPGPGAYFCDPKMVSAKNLINYGVNSTRSSRKFSLSLVKY